MVTNRRNAIKRSLITSSVVSRWFAPTVSVVLLPVHAQTSLCDPVDPPITSMEAENIQCLESMPNQVTFDVTNRGRSDVEFLFIDHPQTDLVQVSPEFPLILRSGETVNFIVASTEESIEACEGNSLRINYIFRNEDGCGGLLVVQGFIQSG